MSFREQININKLPKHIAIIMDGNGRWAQQQGLDRSMGHQEGAISVRRVIEAVKPLGIPYMTLYTFSTENWNRPKEEVDALMALLVQAIARETPDLIENKVSLQAIGDLDRLPQPIREKLNECIEMTSNSPKSYLVLALSYSSRWEIATAAKKAADAYNKGEIKEISEDTFSQYLTTKGMPDPDLLIRTGGEKRISNFLLWQAAYSELYFTDTLWPDFREEALYEAIVDYQRRERRFGKTSEQVQNK